MYIYRRAWLSNFEEPSYTRLHTVTLLVYSTRTSINEKIRILHDFFNELLFRPLGCRGGRRGDDSDGLANPVLEVVVVSHQPQSCPAVLDSRVRLGGVINQGLRMTGPHVESLEDGAQDTEMIGYENCTQVWSNKPSYRSTVKADPFPGQNISSGFALSTPVASAS
ncbi:hypothetical protein L210DRAFT_3505723 [Boletus edulis BED1]|uniref:Uncharacterized protein n=1 Tax=Boletus edulis BED1 TaxID=1328754 RepID=A0AAD4BQC0_BOLED|nr:hypothetical protein L210DRAFT_3505723 [Boletus edulis BED1]